MKKLFLIATVSILLMSCDSSKQNSGNSNGSLEERVNILEKKLINIEKEHDSIITNHNASSKFLFRDDRYKVNKIKQ